MRDQVVLVRDLSKAVSMTAESNALAVATVANWMNVQSWRTVQADKNLSANAYRYEGPSFFDFKVRCDANEDLTSAKLYSIQQETFTFTPVVVASATDIDTTDNEIDITSHSFLTGDGPVYISTAGALPGGITALTKYWIRKISANAISLHTSQADAVSGDNEVDITSAGTGNQTISPISSFANPELNTKRLHWHLMGALNLGNTINVDVQEAYTELIAHSALTLYYAVVATSGVGAQTCTFTLVPAYEEKQ